MMFRCLVLLLFARSISIASCSLDLKKFLRDASDVESPQKTAPNLPNLLIGVDGRIFACLGKNLFAFESTGTLAWILSLNYICNVDIAPVADEKGKIYLVAENKVLEIKPSNIGTPESSVKIFFGSNSTIDRSGKIIGLSISASYSSLFISIKNRGLFTFLLHGQLIWSAGPMLYRFGYRQGCKNNITECYFDSAPVIDQCEGILYISNSEGQVYSLYIRSPTFRWIQDFSSVDKLLTITPGNNGRLYITFPRRALLMALDVSTGNILWQNEVGPLSKEDSVPVIDSNGSWQNLWVIDLSGQVVIPFSESILEPSLSKLCFVKSSSCWISIGSLDGFLYSFSPTGELRKFLEMTASDSVVQASPVLDCSGFAVYISQTMMESKSSRVIGNYTYISAMSPMNIVVTLLAPATGTVYWTGKFPGELSAFFSKTDLRYFQLDERVLLSFLASAGIGNTLPCYTTSQKLGWTCAQGEPKFTYIYTGNETAVVLFVLIQFVILVLLAGFVRFCCIFWTKKKLQDHGLGKFLEKRRSLHKKRKEFSKMISELEQEAAEDATSTGVLQQLGEIVKAKEKVERKLSTSYSLGRDGIGPLRSSILPLYEGKNESHFFYSATKESVTIFNTLSDDDSPSSREECSNGNNSDSGSTSGERGEHWYSCVGMDSRMRGKALVEAGSSSGVSKSERHCEEGPTDNMQESRILRNPIIVEHGIGGSGVTEVRGEGELTMESMQEGICKRRMWLKRRRTLSSTN